MVKWTLRQPYESVEYLPVKIRAYFDLFRPFTLMIAFLSGFALTVGIAGYHGVTLSQSWRTAIYISITFAIINAASNALNQVSDVEEDRISKGYRPIPLGIVSEQEALTLSYMLFFTGLARAFVTSVAFGLVVMLIAAITITYSLHPIRLKKRFLINNLSLAVARGPLPVYAVWLVYGEPNTLAHRFSFALLLYLFAATGTKDFHDVAADKHVGNATLPVVLGSGKALATMLPFLFAPYVVFILTPTLQPLLLTLPLVFAIAFTIRGNESQVVEYNRAWALSYTNLALLYTGFAYILYL